MFYHSRKLQEYKNKYNNLRKQKQSSYYDTLNNILPESSAIISGDRCIKDFQDTSGNTVLHLVLDKLKDNRALLKRCSENYLRPNITNLREAKSNLINVQDNLAHIRNELFKAKDTLADARAKLPPVEEELSKAREEIEKDKAEKIARVEELTREAEDIAVELKAEDDNNPKLKRKLSLIKSKLYVEQIPSRRTVDLTTEIDDLSKIVYNHPEKIVDLESKKKDLVGTEEELTETVINLNKTITNVTDKLFKELVDEIYNEIEDDKKTENTILKTLLTVINGTDDYTNMVKALLDADKYGIFSVNRDGQTSFELAKEYKLNDVVRYMEKLNPKHKFVKNNKFKF
jgi:chromosome segregation ATPase